MKKQRLHTGLEAAPRAKQGCAAVPSFERLNYYYGQPLGVSDFKTEQTYFREKIKLHNRCFHGVGIVCGLEVDPVPQDTDCDDASNQKRKEIERKILEIDRNLSVLEERLSSIDDSEPDEKKAQLEEEIAALEAEKEKLQRVLEEMPHCYSRKEATAAEVIVKCGWALDCYGDEIVVHQDQKIDILQLLDCQTRSKIEQEHGQHSSEYIFELSVCYCEAGTYPSRPILKDACSASSDCVYGRIQERYKFTLGAPSGIDASCSSCCDPCDSHCVPLALIHYKPGEPITVDDIDWRVRRPVGVYQSTVIQSVSWQHAASYSADQVKTLLGTERSDGTQTTGLEFVFSKPVYAQTLQAGVLDLWRVQGGKGLSGVISHIEGSYVDKPDEGLITSFKYRDDSGETLNRGDRVIVTLRSNFILDACCKPVDGENVGGLTPQTSTYADNPELQTDFKQPETPCIDPRKVLTSGEGRPGSTFESWFFIH